MSDWAPRLYGEPCRECSFSWGVELADAKAAIAGVPSHLAALLAGAKGNERHPDLTWSVTAYTLHIGDNLRIWAERLAGIALGGSTIVGSYDESALAEARAYETVSLPAALWTLERSTRDWLEAIAAAPTDLVMSHPERGTIGVDEIVRSNAHDAVHHVWDIERSVASTVVT